MSFCILFKLTSECGCCIRPGIVAAYRIVEGEEGGDDEEEEEES